MRAFSPALPPVRRPTSIAYDPVTRAGVLQIFNPFSYASSNLANIPVLSSSVGTTAVPRGPRCARLDGDNDYCAGGTAIGNALGSAVSELTVSVWIKPSTVSDNDGVIYFGQFVGDQGAFSVILAAGDLYVRTAGVNRIQVAPTVNVWSHLAVTFNAGTLNLYINGVQVGSGSASATLNLAGLSFFLGAYFQNIYTYAGWMYDARVYNLAKSPSEVQAITNQHLTPDVVDRTGLVAAWWLQDESGTTLRDWSGSGRDLIATNVTQSTFHANDAGVKYNAANELGYTQTGNVIIPRNEATPTQDAAGGALQFSGPIALSGVMEVPCWTGNGTNAYIAASSALIPPASDFEFSCLYYHHTNTSYHGIFHQTGSGSLIKVAANLDQSENTSAANVMFFIGTSGNGAAIGPGALTVGGWHRITLTRLGTLFTLSLVNFTTSAVASVTFTSSATLSTANTQIGVYNQFGNGANAGRIADLSITAGGVTKYPLFDQCGPGSANTNRDFYIMGSDGSATLVSGGVVNGTIASIYANRCPYVRDWCIENGGSIAANGAFIPGRIGSSLDAAGNAKTLPAGEHRNPFSRFDPNNWSAPSLVNIGSTASDAYAPSDMEGVQAESVADTRFGSQRRYVAFKVPQIGTDKTNAEGWVL